MMATSNNATGVDDGEDTSRLRLARIELGRIEREIEMLEERPYHASEHELLRSLRSCRAVLLRTADLRLRERGGETVS